MSDKKKIYTFYLEKELYEVLLKVRYEVRLPISRLINDAIREKYVGEKNENLSQ